MISRLGSLEFSYSSLFLLEMASAPAPMIFPVVFMVVVAAAPATLIGVEIREQELRRRAVPKRRGMFFIMFVWSKLRC